MRYVSMYVLAIVYLLFTCASIVGDDLVISAAREVGVEDNSTCRSLAIVEEPRGRNDTPDFMIVA